MNNIPLEVSINYLFVMESYKTFYLYMFKNEEERTQSIISLEKYSNFYSL